MPKSLYDTLEVSQAASPETITAAYRSLLSRYHPDKVASLAAEFRELAERRSTEINLAYETLRDAGRRQAYDRQLRAEQEPPPPPSASSSANTDPGPTSDTRPAHEAAASPKAGTFRRGKVFFENTGEGIYLVIVAVITGLLADLLGRWALDTGYEADAVDVLEKLASGIAFLCGVCGVFVFVSGILITMMQGGRIAKIAGVTVDFAAIVLAVFIVFVEMSDAVNLYSRYPFGTDRPSDFNHRIGVDIFDTLLYSFILLPLIAPRWTHRQFRRPFAIVSWTRRIMPWHRRRSADDI